MKSGADGSSSIVLVVALSACALLVAACRHAPSGPPQNTPATSHRGLLVRDYEEGQTIAYHMTATNQADQYEAWARGVVKKDSSSVWFEEFGWSDLTVQGKPFALPVESQAFRQRLSLDPNHKMGVPPLDQVHPRLIGPITDLLTFYADWVVASHQALQKPGDHAIQHVDMAPSWADGTWVIIGQDSIDFDVELKDVNTRDDVATIIVRHVPPQKPLITIPVEWMRPPVADTPNNWVEVQKNPQGTYAARVGKETFTVEMRVDLRSGRILSGTLNNVVEVLERQCEDAALTQAGDPVRYQIKRHIEIR